MNFIAFDAAMGLLGGVLIGLSAALMLIGNGRIAGISGLAASLIGDSDRRVLNENLMFLGGLLLGPLAYALVFGAPAINVSREPLLLIGAGLLVGVGTRLGSGCTSGHGVCGLSRFSVRSMVATATFMAVAVVTASVVSSLWGAP